jgi:hypothetical protein
MQSRQLAAHGNFVCTPAPPPRAGVARITPALFDFPFPLPLAFFAHASHPKLLGRTSLIFMHAIFAAAQKDCTQSYAPCDANEDGVPHEQQNQNNPFDGSRKRK